MGAERLLTKPYTVAPAPINLPDIAESHAEFRADAAVNALSEALTRFAGPVTRSSNWTMSFDVT
jgi:hypothetical protein